VRFPPLSPEMPSRSSVVGTPKIFGPPPAAFTLPNPQVSASLHLLPAVFRPPRPFHDPSPPMAPYLLAFFHVPIFLYRFFPPFRSTPVIAHFFLRSGRSLLPLDSFPFSVFPPVPLLLTILPLTFPDFDFFVTFSCLTPLTLLTVPPRCLTPLSPLSFFPSSPPLLF